MDRRQHERYDLEGPLTFSWTELQCVRHRQEGLLSNMSGGGVFISTDDSPPVGTSVQFKLLFHSFLAGSRLVMRASARVVRRESAARAGGRVD
jgi:hypothetical protein